MKKFLSLVLALVMTMSLVTVAGAKDFTDDSDVNYDAAVAVISELGIVGGYADGSFNPDGNLTRGAAAKIICNVMVGPETAATLKASTAPFSDVPTNHTFAGYIAYCVENGIISGYDDGTFRAGNTLTGYAFMKMLLCALGYDQKIEGYVGSNNWINIAEGVVAKELDDGLAADFQGAKALTREEACLYVLNALMAKTVKYSDKGQNIVIGDITITSDAGDAEDTTKLLKDKNFKSLKSSDTTDALGRPATKWEYDGDEIGTFADDADLVIVNKQDADDIADILDDADIEDPSALVKAADTANGVTLEIFTNDDDEVTTVVRVAASVYSYDAGELSYGKDKVSTKDKDERSVTFAGLKKVVADKDVVKGTELDNFEELYAAISDEDDDLKILVVTNKAGTEVVSAEILEIVEAPITRVQDGGYEIVAGGETYTTAVAASIAKDGANLYIADNGIVYAITGADADESEVIYVDVVTEDEDKWGEKTYTAQIVNEENEITEVVVDQKYAQGFYTYEINSDDEYELTKATTDVAGATKMDEDNDYIKNGADKKVYFADDMVVVYIADTKADLEVTVKEGVQDGAQGDFFVTNSDDEITVVYVIGEYEDGESDDVIYVADAKKYGTALNDDDKEADVYNVYVGDEEVKIMVKKGTTVKAGFWTYTIDSKTGEYKLETEKGYTGVTVTVEGKNNNLVTYAAAGIEDAPVTGEIYDLTDEGLTSLKAVKDWDGDPVVVSFMYDKDEEEVTVLYVDFA